VDAIAVALSRGEMGELVADHFFEKSGLGFAEERSKANEATLRIAASEATGHSRRPLDGRSSGELARVPESEPALGGSDRIEGKGVHGLATKANTKRGTGVRFRTAKFREGLSR
jgi:hypothetical protein